MPKFTFRLDPVLEHRQRLEDEQQRALAAVLLELHQAEVQRDDYIKRRAEMRDRLIAHHADMDSVDLRATYAHCDYLDRSIVSQQAIVDYVRAKADKERAKLVLKVQDKKVLEVLKERRRETFESEVTAREQAESDEINSRHYHGSTTGETSS
jgi:flagellar export protein FliJ